jgi:hypothetical protein
MGQGGALLLANLCLYCVCCELYMLWGKPSPNQQMCDGVFPTGKGTGK